MGLEAGLTLDSKIFVLALEGSAKETRDIPSSGYPYHVYPHLYPPGYLL